MNICWRSALFLLILFARSASAQTDSEAKLQKIIATQQAMIIVLNEKVARLSKIVDGAISSEGGSYKWIGMSSGLKGEKGDPGTNGTNGSNGTNGANGANGANGSNATMCGRNIIFNGTGGRTLQFQLGGPAIGMNPKGFGGAGNSDIFSMTCP